VAPLVGQFLADEAGRLAPPGQVARRSQAPPQRPAVQVQAQARRQAGVVRELQPGAVVLQVALDSAAEAARLHDCA
jgi:hypothetical protein